MVRLPLFPGWMSNDEPRLPPFAVFGAGGETWRPSGHVALDADEVRS
jgi:hypothetical protein